MEGAWWPGAVLGWRHDESGGCEAEVRVVHAGAPQVRWVDLAAVRLPEPPAAAEAPVPGPPPAETVMMSRSELRGLLASGLPAGRRRRHAADLTAEVPVVRWAEADAGRHRAPAAMAGRHRAGDDTGRLAPLPAPRSGGLESERWTRPIRMDDVAGWPWSESAVTSG